MRDCCETLQPTNPSTEQSACEKRKTRELAQMEAARDYLNGYRVCEEMLRLRRHERKREKKFDDSDLRESILAGSEAFWRARMCETEYLISSLKNGREKLVLYHHYIRGESIERTADILGFSRRTGYRVHQKGLLTVGAVLERMQWGKEKDTGET